MAMVASLFCELADETRLAELLNDCLAANGIGYRLVPIT